eukprot:ctg_3019.g407
MVRQKPRDGDSSAIGSISHRASPSQRGLKGFSSLGLDGKTVVRALLRKGYTFPTPIQRRMIPVVLSGRDVVAMARTGSGKTAAFLCPLIQRVASGGTERVGVRALILSPTRELAVQTFGFLRDYARYVVVRAGLVVGGESLEAQFALLAGNPEVLVATPGRLRQLLQQVPGFGLHAVEVAVFDEADRLWEGSLLRETLAIVEALDARAAGGDGSAACQKVLVSATMPAALAEFSRAALREPQLVRLDVERLLSPAVTLEFFVCAAAVAPGGGVCGHAPPRRVFGDAAVEAPPAILCGGARPHGSSGAQRRRAGLSAPNGAVAAGDRCGCARHRLSVSGGGRQLRLSVHAQTLRASVRSRRASRPRRRLSVAGGHGGRAGRHGRCVPVPGVHADGREERGDGTAVRPPPRGAVGGGGGDGAQRASNRYRSGQSVSHRHARLWTGATDAAGAVGGLGGARQDAVRGVDGAAATSSLTAARLIQWRPPDTVVPRLPNARIAATERRGETTADTAPQLLAELDTRDDLPEQNSCDVMERHACMPAPSVEKRDAPAPLRCSSLPQVAAPVARRAAKRQRREACLAEQRQYSLPSYHEHSRATARWREEALGVERVHDAVLDLQPDDPAGRALAESATDGDAVAPTARLRMQWDQRKK